MNLLFEWSNQQVKVKILKPIPQIKENKIHYIKEQVITEIPLWMAKILKENGMVEILDENKIDMTKLDKISWREKNNPNLQPLEDNFYIKIKEYLEHLAREFKDNPSTQLNDAKNTTKRFLDDILFHRLYKIMRIIEAKNKRQLMTSLTNEEKILFKKMMADFEEWKASILPESD